MMKQDSHPDTAETMHPPMETQVTTTTETPEEPGAASPKEPVVISYPATLSSSPVWRAVTVPSPVTFLCVVVMVALLSFGIGAGVSASSGSSGSTTTSMNGLSATPNPDVPDAKQTVGNQM